MNFPIFNFFKLYYNGAMTTKEMILETLSENEGNAVSGEILAEKCGVSRAAVWKAITSLREQGLSITGTTNGGYILEGEADIVSEGSFLNHLKKNHPEYAGIHVECFSEIDSTNNYAKKLLSSSTNLRTPTGELTEDGKKYHMSAYMAEHQTAGKGRLGRTFVSPVKSGVYLTMIYAPEGGVRDPAKLTALSAVATARAIRNIFGKEIQIKWINDIFYNGRKAGGILTEGSTNFETGTIESAVIGIGLNIEKDETLPEEVKAVAGSLFDAGEKKTGTRCQLAAEITAQCFSIFQEDERTAFDEYKKYSFILGQTITVYPLIGDERTAYQAKAVDIDNEAGLVVELPDGTRKTLKSGEVTLKSSSMVRN